MFRWMFSHRDMWIACKYGGVQMDASTEGLVATHEKNLIVKMDASTEGLVAACEHPGTPFRWILRQMDLLRNLNGVLCLLLMLQQMDLLHMDIVKIVKVCLLWMSQQMDLLHIDIVMILLCYVICTRLFVEASV